MRDARTDPAGDAALTRRSRKHSTLVAFVLKWSRARPEFVVSWGGGKRSIHCNCCSCQADSKRVRSKSVGNVRATPGACPLVQLVLNAPN